MQNGYDTYIKISTQSANLKVHDSTDKDEPYYDDESEWCTINEQISSSILSPSSESDMSFVINVELLGRRSKSEHFDKDHGLKETYVNEELKLSKPSCSIYQHRQRYGNLSLSLEGDQIGGNRCLEMSDKLSDGNILSRRTLMSLVADGIDNKYYENSTKSKKKNFLSCVQYGRSKNSCKKGVRLDDSVSYPLMKPLQINRASKSNGLMSIEVNGNCINNQLDVNKVQVNNSTNVVICDPSLKSSSRKYLTELFMNSGYKCFSNSNQRLSESIIIIPDGKNSVKPLFQNESIYYINDNEHFSRLRHYTDAHYLERKFINEQYLRRANEFNSDEILLVSTTGVRCSNTKLKDSSVNEFDISDDLSNKSEIVEDISFIENNSFSTNLNIDISVLVDSYSKIDVQDNRMRNEGIEALQNTVEENFNRVSSRNKVGSLSKEHIYTKIGDSCESDYLNTSVCSIQNLIDKDNSSEAVTNSMDNVMNSQELKDAVVHVLKGFLEENVLVSNIKNDDYDVLIIPKSESSTDISYLLQQVKIKEEVLTEKPQNESQFKKEHNETKILDSISTVVVSLKSSTSCRIDMKRNPSNSLPSLKNSTFKEKKTICSSMLSNILCSSISNFDTRPNQFSRRSRREPQEQYVTFREDDLNNEEYPYDNMMMKLRIKHKSNKEIRRRKHKKPSILCELNKFKKILSEIEIRQNVLISKLCFDPCGLAYRFPGDIKFDCV